MENNNKKIWILLGLLAVIVIIVIAAMVQNKKTPGVGNNTDNNSVAVTGDTNTPATPQAPTPVVSDNPVLKDAVVVVPGASPVTKDDKVVNAQGEQTNNAAVPLSPTAPMQTEPINKASLGASVIKIDVSSTGFSPNEFTVNAGAAVTMSLTSLDGASHVLMFNDPSLMAVAIGIMPNETRAITFNAPAAGEYTFRCDIPGHLGRGETGKMIVK